MKLKDLIARYEIKDMRDWYDVNANLVITDPPFGIEFTGKESSYQRDAKVVVDGYIEWSVDEYGEMVDELLDCISRNLVSDGQALIFSGWENSYIIQERIMHRDDMILQGKLYWGYNFPVYTVYRPRDCVYEIFWITKRDSWKYNSECSTKHCKIGGRVTDKNTNLLLFEREMIPKHKIRLKYPTRLPFRLLQCLLEHYSDVGDLVFDPLAGSGMVGIASYLTGRNFVLGDLNPNGKEVFKALIEYYISEGVLKAEKVIRIEDYG